MYNGAIFFGVSVVKYIILPYFLGTLYQNNHLFTEKGVWKELEEKELWHETERGSSKSLLNSFHIKKLELDF